MLFSMTNNLYFYISIFWGICTVPNMAALCSSLMLYSPDNWTVILWMIEMIQVRRCYYWSTGFSHSAYAILLFHGLCMLQFLSFFVITCVSAEVLMSINRHVILSLFLLSLSSSSSSSSAVCRVLIHIILRKTMSLENTVLQLFCYYYSWCLYR